MSIVQIVSNNEYAEQLARAHFQLVPELTQVVQLDSNRENLPDEPLKLIEVNTETAERGLYPIHFGARVEGAAWYPAVIIYELTPNEFARIQQDPSQLPGGVRIGKIFSRSDFWVVST